MSIIIPVVVNETPPIVEYQCRRCHRGFWVNGCEAVYCPYCGKDELMEVPDAPWSLKRKLIVWSVFAGIVVGTYLAIAWGVGIWPFPYHYPW